MQLIFISQPPRQAGVTQRLTRQNFSSQKMVQSPSGWNGSPFLENWRSGNTNLFTARLVLTRHSASNQLVFVLERQLRKFALIALALLSEIGANAKAVMEFLRLEAVPLQSLSGFCPVRTDNSVSGFIASLAKDLVSALSSRETFGSVILTGAISGTE